MEDSKSKEQTVYAWKSQDGVVRVDYVHDAAMKPPELSRKYYVHLQCKLLACQNETRARFLRKRISPVHAFYAPRGSACGALSPGANYYAS